MAIDKADEQDLQYLEIRDQIQDGDLFLFRGTVFLSLLIEKYSHGQYSHCAIAANWGDRKMVLQAELVGGVQAIPASVAIGAYRGRVDWFQILPEVRAKMNIAAMLAEAKSDLGLTYATSDLLRVAAHNIFSAALPADCDDPKALFCSQYVARCYRRAGCILGPTDVGVSPSGIAGAAHALKFRGVILHDPDSVPARSRDEILLRT
jgi:hypothetical protein